MTDPSGPDPGPAPDRPLLWVPFLDGVLVHHVPRRTVHVLNATAAAVWEAARAVGPDAAVVAAVAERFAQPVAAVEPDATRTLAELRLAGLLPGSAEDDPQDDAGPAAAAGGGAPRRLDAPVPPPASGDPAAGDRRLGPLRLLHLHVTVDGPEEAVDPLRPLVAALGAPAPVPAQADRAGYRLRPAPGQDGRWLLELDGRPLHGPAALEAVHRHLLWHANHRAIGDERTWLVLHAGAVAGDGGAVALPGPPDAGKSTLTAALCRRGLRYVTDEAVALDGDATVHPYPKPLTLDPRSLALLDVPAGTAVAGHLPPTAVGAVAPEPVPLTAVVLPERRPGAGATLERLDPAEAALALAGATFNLPATGDVGLAALADVAARVPVHRLVLDDLHEAAQLVAVRVAAVAG